MNLILIALTILALAVGVVVLFSYTIAWCEAANREPQLMKQRFKPAVLIFAIRLMAMEFCYLLATVLAHPLGWIPVPQKTRGQGTPVLLLHGLFHNRSCWWLFKHRLRQSRSNPVYSMTLNYYRKDIEPLTEAVAKKIDLIRFRHGVERVDLIGHSMGGLIARNLIQLREGSDKVRHCVCLGSPHGGSRLAPLAVTPVGQDLIPNSDFLKRLAAAPIPGNVQFTSIFSRNDNLVLPFDSGRMEGAHNMELSGLGHSTLLYHRDAFEAAIKRLQEEDENDPDRHPEQKSG
ncbi:alpha/beta fold hydrolase [Geoalkalibacter subterraneus]|uniref:GPI inositol-deacylase PGAP1-like alpha/beta domain-containing protein n=1 Tax=Geoalkalibacter subterraneus TaxID=483547 RepID=A0A0B5FQM1_9BACT|nr:alpha/beta fold hydrolase [Geoalkalibacter subterraneus]AJF05891.1 hypothetical protein GSUB_03990 [Geoalkalibacter subterraneus]